MRTSLFRFRRIAVLAVALTVPLIAPPALSDTIVRTTTEKARPTDSEKEVGFREGSIVVAPIPSKGIELGWGLALGAGYLFKMDENSSTSSLFAGYFESENGSRAYGLGTDLAWSDDIWRFRALAGEAEVNYNLYLLGLPIPLRQSGTFGDLELFRAVAPDLYLGGKLQYLNTDIGIRAPQNIPPEILPDIGLEMLSASLSLHYDTRNDNFYPTKGIRFEGNLTYGEALDGPRDGYSKVVAKLKGYHSIGENGVLAGLATGCLADENTPFFLLCSLGGTDGFRGYSPMRYIDEQLLSVQVEYRHRIGSRFGIVAFAGTGSTGSRFDEDDDDSGWHSSAGLGLRIRLSKKFPLDYSIDVAINDEKEESLSLYVGQRF